MTDDWPHVCVLCAVRGRQTRLRFGHVCASCADRIAADLRAIPELAAMAAACLEPASSTGAGSRSVPSSRPPLNVEALDPALANVPGHDAVLLVLLEEWCRLIRDMRGMTPYGPASAAHAAETARKAAQEPRRRDRMPSGGNDTGVTLTGVTGFLGAQVAWMVDTPDFPIEDFAGEVRACVKALRRWDVMAEERGQVIPCPTVTEDGECGRRLHYRSMDERVTCRACGATRDVPQLLMAADADNALVDGEALAQRFSIDPSTIRKWARFGHVERAGQRYRFGDVRVMVEAMRGRSAG